MPVIAQIPTLLSVSYDNTRDKAYLQLQLDADPTFMLEGQLFLNVALNRMYYRDNAFVVHDVDVKNVALMDTAMLGLLAALESANLETVTTIPELVGLLIDFRTVLRDYDTNRET